MLEIKQKSKCTVDNEKPYKLKVGDTKVFFEYSNNNKTFKECMLNILNKKDKTGWHFFMSTLYFMLKGGRLINGGKKIKVLFWWEYHK